MWGAAADKLVDVTALILYCSLLSVVRWDVGVGGPGVSSLHAGRPGRYMQR
jgi:hypothetical protein